MRTKPEELCAYLAHHIFEPLKMTHSGFATMAAIVPQMSEGYSREGSTLPADLSDGILTAYQASTLNLQGTELRPKRGSTKFDDRVWTLTPSASLPTNY
jgi:CubicO group peptidase (beta-lactamase class C family)